MHLKRLAMPKSWPLARKGKKRFIAAGKGPAPAGLSLPLTIVLRDMLGVVTTKAEAKKVLKQGNVLVDNRVVKDERFRLGLFDRLYIKKTDKGFTLELEKRTLKIRELSKEQLNKKPAKVLGKRFLKKGIIQINLYGGKNVLMPKAESEKIKVGDTLIIDLVKRQVVKHLQLAQGAFALVIAGRHQGECGQIIALNGLLTLKDKKEFRTAKQNVFVIEK